MKAQEASGQDRPDSAIVAGFVRTGLFWERGPGGSVRCSLCYRRCHIPEGGVGFCQIRRNDGGALVLPEYGSLSTVTLAQLGFGRNSWASFHPGGLGLFIGGVSCTSRCTFCLANAATWHWGKLAREEADLSKGGWLDRLGRVQPADVVALAKRVEADHIFYSGTEATLDIEFVLDLGRAAKAAGIALILGSNGLTTPEAVRALAPYTSALALGVKGSLSDTFYSWWMSAPGGPGAVRTSALEWKRQGVHLELGNLVAPPELQDAEDFESSTRAYYQWIMEELGPTTPVFPNAMNRPRGGERKFYTKPSNWGEYERRWHLMPAIAREAGLRYFSTRVYGSDRQEIVCADCGGVLVKLVSPQLRCEPCTGISNYCPYWRHEQFVTEDGHCQHCGAQTPVKVLSPERLARTEFVVRWFAQQAPPADRRPTGLAGVGALMRMNWGG